jgi:hypothetical protein
MAGLDPAIHEEARWLQGWLMKGNLQYMTVGQRKRKAIPLKPTTLSHSDRRHRAFSSEVCAVRVKKMRKNKNLERFHVSIKI